MIRFALFLVGLVLGLAWPAIRFRIAELLPSARANRARRIEASRILNEEIDKREAELKRGIANHNERMKERYFS